MFDDRGTLLESLRSKGFGCRGCRRWVEAGACLAPICDFGDGGCASGRPGAHGVSAGGLFVFFCTFQIGQVWRVSESEKVPVTCEVAAQQERTCLWAGRC